MNDHPTNPDQPHAEPGDVLAAMRAFQAGDPDAFDALHAHLWPRVWLRACKMGLDATDAEEIAQKVLVRVYLSGGRARFDSRGRLWSWVYTIAAREIYKHWHRRRPGLVSADGLAWLADRPTDPDDDPARAAAGAEVLRDVEACLGGLDEASRLYLLGPLLQGLTFRQAAALHGMTLGQFKHQYEKALQAVRDCLDAKGHFPPTRQRTDRGEGDSGG